METLEDELREAVGRSAGVPALSTAAEVDGQMTALAVGDLAGPHVRFQAASISKVVAAEVVLALVADGVFGLETPVVELVPELRPRLRVGWRWDPHVTVRMVLAHRAGLVDGAGFPGYPVGTALPSIQQIVDGDLDAGVSSAPLQVGVVPGLQYRYSGVGYQVLQLAIERTTGAPYADVARTRVLEPAGMATASFSQPPAAGDPDFAVGHVDGGTAIDGGWHVYPELAAAGMWCTPTDLLALHRFVLRRPSAWLRSEGPTPWGGYGLGLQFDDRATVGHTGGNLGFACWLVGSLDGRHRVAVMCNGEDRGLPRLAGSILARSIGWDAIDAPDPAPSADDPMARLAGTYEGDGHRAVLTSDPALGLVVTIDDQPPLRLSFQAPDLTARGLALTLRVGEDGGVRTLTIRQPGLTLRLTRAEPPGR
jgi:CubicO group peptidase (beta-lactamase class C family)